MRKHLSGSKSEAEIQKLIHGSRDSRLTITPEGYLFLTGYDSLVIINLEKKNCYSVMTTESCRSGKIDVPPCYAVTTSDSNQVAIVWNKTAQKAVHAFSCHADEKRFMTINFHIMPDGKVMRREYQSFQVMGLHKSRFPFLYGDYYHSVDATYSVGSVPEFLLAFPDNKQFLYRGFPKRSEKKEFVAKTRIFDLEAGEPVHDAAVPNHGASVMLTDGRVVHLSHVEGGLITQYYAIEKHMHPLKDATAFRPRC